MEGKVIHWGRGIRIGEGDRDVGWRGERMEVGGARRQSGCRLGLI